MPRAYLWHVTLFWWLIYWEIVMALDKWVARWLMVVPVALALHSGVHAETVARYGISMADIPLTTGQPDRGAGAYQFTGHTIYDPLIALSLIHI